ncbi:MAG: hypothetical protein EOP46_01635 [Sphingobacteriaceae bacterium]|nr:MAG: hypothetical protein EOP46_01635 [Sphingobacteriaceae bacterium]
MQTILVPTDFKVSSLDCVAAISEQFTGEEVKFIFVHMFKLSDSITDLLMLSRRSREYEVIEDGFYNRCIQIKRDNPLVNDIKVEFLYGSTLSMFRNFIEANNVTQILNVDDCSVGKINKSSINPSTLIQKSGLPVITATRPVVAEEVQAVKVKPELELSEV